MILDRSPALTTSSLLSARSRARSAVLALLVYSCPWIMSAGESVANSPPIEIVALRLGFEGAYKVGYWVPVEVTIQGGPSDVQGVLELTVLDGDGTPGVVGSAVHIPAGEVVRERLYTKFGRPDGNLTIGLRVGDEIVARRQFSPANATNAIPKALGVQTELILAFGPSIGLDEVASRGQDRGAKVKVVHLKDTDPLPTRWLGYDGVDLVVISAEPVSIDAERVQALERWIELGGKLILMPGAHAAEMIGSAGNLAQFAPGRFASLTPLSLTTQLESFIGSTFQIARRGKPLEVVRFQETSGTVQLHEGNLPLIIRTPRVFGEIIFVGVDLTRTPLAEWQGRTAFVQRLLWGVPDATHDQANETAAATRLGYSDLAGQLRSALDQFRSVARVEFWLVGALAVVYILCIGPLDYFLLRKLRRMPLTWLSFSFFVIVFGLTSHGLAKHMKGERLRVNQVDLVDVDNASGQVRGTTWFNVFTPRSAAYDVALRPRIGGDDAGAKEVLLSWFGLAGSGLGGMEVAPGGPSPLASEYQFSPDLDRIGRVPLQVWSSKSFVGQWTSRWNHAAIEGNLTAGPDGVAEGTLASHLDVPLRQCLLASGHWAYVIGEIKPGETIRLRAGEQRDLQPVLKDYRLIREKNDNLGLVPTPYDPSSSNIQAILRQMMFYEAADGLRYTGLANRYQSAIDFSDRLELGRAVLVGMTEEQGGCEVLLDDQPAKGSDDTRATFYRFMFSLSPQTPRGTR